MRSGIVLINIGILLRAIVVKILSNRTAVKYIIWIYLCGLGSVNFYPVERGSLFVIVMQIIDIVAKERSIDTRGFIQYNRISSIAWNPAQAVIVIGKNRKIFITAAVIADIVDIVVICIDIHCGISTQFAEVGTVCVHGI